MIPKSGSPVFGKDHAPPIRRRYPRFDHQPKRRGFASAAGAAGSGAAAAGSGAEAAAGGASAAGAGCTSLIAPEENIGAGSRTVERRFGGSAGMAAERLGSRAAQRARPARTAPACARRARSALPRAPVRRDRRRRPPLPARRLLPHRGSGSSAAVAGLREPSVRLARRSGRHIRARPRGRAGCGVRHGVRAGGGVHRRRALRRAVPAGVLSVLLSVLRVMAFGTGAIAFARVVAVMRCVLLRCMLRRAFAATAPSRGSRSRPPRPRPAAAAPAPLSVLATRLAQTRPILRRFRLRPRRLRIRSRVRSRSRSRLRPRSPRPRPRRFVECVFLICRHGRGLLLSARRSPSRPRRCAPARPSRSGTAARRRRSRRH